MVSLVTALKLVSNTSVTHFSFKFEIPLKCVNASSDITRNIRAGNTDLGFIILEFKPQLWLR